MKGKIQGLVLIASTGLVIVALLTNPNKSTFVEHIKKEMKKDGFLGTIGSALVPFVFNENISSFNDCGFFSLVKFHTFLYIGIFGKWIRMK